MKAKILFAALLLLASANMMADGNQYLTLTSNNTEDDIPLPIVQKISFENGFVVVKTSEGTCSFPISVLDKITFTEKEDATAIEAMPEQAKDLTYKNGTLAVKGDGLLRIYGTNGALVSIANVKEGANISLENLPAGVYIVRMGEKVIKLRK